jgi:hypothetical protein
MRRLISGFYGTLGSGKQRAYISWFSIEAIARGHKPALLRPATLLATQVALAAPPNLPCLACGDHQLGLAQLKGKLDPVQAGLNDFVSQPKAAALQQLLRPLVTPPASLALHEK